MIDWADVTPILVTRGDVDLAPIIATLPFFSVVIWNNGDGSRADLAVYGRYAAIAETWSPYIFVCDDDVILNRESYDALLAAHEPGHVTCNMPQRFRDTGFYDDHALVGFGAIFDRDLPEQAFKRFGYHESWAPGADEIWGRSEIAGAVFPDRTVFHRTCDIVFTALTPRILIDVPYSDREFASAPNRMWKTEGHVAERTRMLEFARKVCNA